MDKGETHQMRIAFPSEEEAQRQAEANPHLTFTKIETDDCKAAYLVSADNLDDLVLFFVSGNNARP